MDLRPWRPCANSIPESWPVSCVVQQVPTNPKNCGAAYVIAELFLLDNLANILRLLANGVPADLLPLGEGQV